MRRFGYGYWMLLVSSALSLALGGQYDDIFNGRTSIVHSSPFAGLKTFSKHKAPMHKALFTQRGYIQFLRWELPVPEIEEFTFCLWVKSTNLTYSHSIFSYSKNEEKRLVRSWISPFGRSVHLEIGETEVLAYPTDIKEHRWYHICQSWENGIGRYGLWIDGQKEIEGYATQTIGHVIPSKGDIVVGQEYTDFDKGLEEGIEGAVVGFNFVLSSAFDKPLQDYYLPTGGIQNVEENLSPFVPIGEENRVPESFGSYDPIETAPYIDPGLRIHPGLALGGGDERFRRYSKAQGAKILNEKSEGMFDSTLKEYLGDGSTFPGGVERTGANDRGQRVIAVKFVHRTKRDTRRVMKNRTKRRGGGGTESPLGLQLVDLSYRECRIGRGSPFIGGSKMLISWTRTPVKVFGGAIIKDAKSDCGNF